jgi:hypothetical protein
MQRDPATDHAGQRIIKPEDVRREIEVRLSALNTQRTIDASKRLDRVLEAGIKEGKRLSKLGSIAGRITAKKASHDAKADEWAARLDAIDEREPEAFAIGDAVIEERETDLADMEREMRTLSNLPNVVSGGSSQGSK